jgi:hypothetical protein
MYEMGGLARTRRTKPSQLPGFAVAARRRRCQAPVRGPVSRLLPRSQGRPQVVPVSSGESISTASANAAQEPEVNYFGFFRYPHGIHKRQAVVRTCRWLSTGLFTTRPQLSGVAQRIPAPAVAACNRLIFPSLFRVITHMAAREPLVQAPSVPMALRFPYLAMLRVSGRFAVLARAVVDLGATACRWSVSASTASPTRIPGQDTQARAGAHLRRPRPARTARSPPRPCAARSLGRPWPGSPRRHSPGIWDGERQMRPTDLWSAASGRRPGSHRPPGPA